MESPLESLELPGSPVSSIQPLTACPIRHLNMIGIPAEDISPLLEMQLKSLLISPLKLNKEQFNILEKIEVTNLIGPGDPADQVPEEFFEKYLKLLES